jgi:hypothetical protein
MRVNYLFLKWSIPCLVIVYLVIFLQLNAIEKSERLRIRETIHRQNHKNETIRELNFQGNLPKQKISSSLGAFNSLYKTSEHRNETKEMQKTNHPERDSKMLQKSRFLGTVLILAPQRNEITFWYDTSRFCFLMRAVRSVDKFLNQRFGPYPITILVAKDHELDPRMVDGPYTERDKALIRSWAPNSTILFEEINMYSDDALEQIRRSNRF